MTKLDTLTIPKLTCLTQRTQSLRDQYANYLEAHLGYKDVPRDFIETTRLPDGQWVLEMCGLPGDGRLHIESGTWDDIGAMVHLCNSEGTVCWSPMSTMIVQQQLKKNPDDKDRAILDDYHALVDNLLIFINEEFNGHTPT